MKTQYAKIEDFKIIAIHKDEELQYFVIVDRNGERLSTQTFEKASDAIEHGYKLTTKKRTIK